MEIRPEQSSASTQTEASITEQSQLQDMMQIRPEQSCTPSVSVVVKEQVNPVAIQQPHFKVVVANRSSISDHTYSREEPRKGLPKGLPIHLCIYCKVTVSSAHHLKIHQTEICRRAPKQTEKDYRCTGCGQMYTRNGLRWHLNKIVSGKRKIPKKHGNMTIQEHKDLLAKITLK